MPIVKNKEQRTFLSCEVGDEFRRDKNATRTVLAMYSELFGGHTCMAVGLYIGL
jgi:hypothetical protein